MTRHHRAKREHAVVMLHPDRARIRGAAGDACCAANPGRSVNPNGVSTTACCFTARDGGTVIAQGGDASAGKLWFCGRCAPTPTGNGVEYRAAADDRAGFGQRRAGGIAHPRRRRIVRGAPAEGCRRKRRLQYRVPPRGQYSCSGGRLGVRVDRRQAYRPGPTQAIRWAMPFRITCRPFIAYERAREKIKRASKLFLLGGRWGGVGGELSRPRPR